VATILSVPFALLLVHLTVAQTPQSMLFFSGETSGTLLNAATRGPVAELTFGYALRGGAAFGRWSAFTQLEHNLWKPLEQDSGLVPGVLNIGVGAGLSYAGARMRGSLALGPSILLFSTAIDRAGSVGLFVDFRPASIRFRPTSSITLVLDCIAFSLAAPVLSGLPLMRVQYRTILGVEFGT
jgi:hypothetical protein